MCKYTCSNYSLVVLYCIFKHLFQEIIGGMLDLDHALWRKPKKEKLDQQTKKVLEFTKIWKSFDCTKNK